MQYVGKVFSTVSQLYKELNPATLSGAIDVVVVEDSSGELRCSPFHVRFGKLQLLRPSDKAVQIIVNDTPADFYMKVGDSGEGFFVVETDSDVPSQFATSPVASPALSFRDGDTSDPGEPDFLDLSGNVRVSEINDAGYVSAHESDGAEDGERAAAAMRPQSAVRLPFLDDMAIGVRHEAILHQLDDGRASRLRKAELRGHVEGRHRRALSVVSDSELVLGAESKPLRLDARGARGQGKGADDELHTDWDWGVKLAPPQVAPTSAAVTPAATTASEATPAGTHNEATNTESQPPAFDIAMLLQSADAGKVSLSRCGMQAWADDQAAFERAQVRFEEFAVDPAAVLADPDLVFRVGDGVVMPRDELLAALVSQLAFGRAPAVPSEEEEEDEERPTAANAGAELDKSLPLVAPKPERRWWRWGQRTVSAAGDLAGESAVTAATAGKLAEPAGDSVAIDVPLAGDGYLSDDAQVTHPLKAARHYAKTLRLTSEQLRSLNLQRGANDVKFLVASNNAYCEARIFLYKHDTQIVISDIDGTITKSDALGHLFNMVGKDWTHHGVAKLYTDIVGNGYEILYLTSRAIGQADGTRYFLSNVKQGEYKLPLGALLLSSDRLFTSFHREVIMRRPHEFKMACLRDIKNLFGDDSPFYAGFGNRITDAMSYRSVNVPVSRICTIDTSGEIKLDLLPGYKSSYVGMNDLVDMMFPALSSKLDQTFNDWEYWKPGLPSIDAELAALDAELELLQSAANKTAEAEKSRRADSAVSPRLDAAPELATRESRALSSGTVPADLRPAPAAAGMLSSPDLLLQQQRQRADSWTTPAASAPASAPEPTVSSAGAGSGRMSMLKKAAFSPFSLVRGSPAVQSRPAPKFEYERSSTVMQLAAQTRGEEEEFPELPQSGSPRSVPDVFDFGGEVAEDPAVAAAAARLVPQVRRINSAAQRVDSSASLQSQYSDDAGSHDEDEDDEEIDQETLDIMHDMEEVQRLQ
ncbi:lipin Ned1 [Coemansia sp. RSA 2711]|nr:lipin Ned1 [Coemansia sp. RSA 2711]